MSNLELLQAEAEYSATSLKEIETAYHEGQATHAEYRLAYQDDCEARRALRKFEIEN
jgi:hypothetical protein